MFNAILTKIVGSKHDRDIKKLRPLLERINGLEAELLDLSMDQLRAKTAVFKERCSQGAELDELLPESFAVCREVARRELSMRHYDVQLIGGIALHEGKIAEMKTGEGKTLMATLPAYLNSLSGKGVHVVTVNDYLARRDSAWMGRVYGALGLTVGVIQHDMDDEERRAAYAADITYGTNNEYGFDFLRDNMKHSVDDMVRRGQVFAIIDEVDSILIDEARTPLIISGPAEDRAEHFSRADKVIPRLKPELHFQVDEKSRTATFTEDGIEQIERLLNFENLYDPEHQGLVHQLYNSLKAHTLFKRDVDYVVQDGQVIIVDEFTGRLMPGRRWSEGLHQAVEAKERVKIERESQTYATITFQNYFRMYDKLSGMTGTAETEAAEFGKTYKLDVVVIPPNRPLIRDEYPDVVYRTEGDKFEAIIREIVAMHARGRPVLVGTISIDKSERLSEMLNKHLKRVLNARPIWFGHLLQTAGIVSEDLTTQLDKTLSEQRVKDIIAKPARLKELLKELEVEPNEAAERFISVVASGKIPHVVLNAKHHEKEAEIVALAGRLGAVTIATNMAGRGTDIVLGGSPETLAKKELGEDIEIENLELFRQTTAGYEAECQREHEDVVARGGLHILGSERHESRRIDNQLRGRAGRQGDPGSSRFYLSLEDDLMRIFVGSSTISRMMQSSMEDGEPIEHKMVTRAIERAQKQVEGQNFEMRKHLLEYDDVFNKQREAFYGLRREILSTDDMKEYVLGMAEEVVIDDLDVHMAEDADVESWDLVAFSSRQMELFGIDISAEREGFKQKSRDEIHARIAELLEQKYERKEIELGAEQMQQFGQQMMLQGLDSAWRDHLYSLDHLKEGIQLRSYGQRDPLVEYKRESYSMFKAMWDTVQEGMLRGIYLFRPVLRQPAPAPTKQLSYDAGGSGEADAKRPVKKGPKTGRNEPCHCGSGKKYKKCHGA